jgi:hypothetical protein
MDSFNNNGGLRVTPGMETNWRITSKWAMFFAVLGFIGAGIYLLLAFAIMPAPIANMIGSFAWIFVLFYLLALACVFFLSLFHLKFSNGITRAMNFTDQQAFTAAWRNFRNHFRLYGIMVIVFIALYIIMIIAVLTMVGTATSSQFN